MGKNISDVLGISVGDSFGLSNEKVVKISDDELEGIIASGQTSTLLYWEVFDFTSFSHAKFAFDGNNVICFEGFNGSGKTNALSALRLNLTAHGKNMNKTKYKIRRGKKEARIITAWSDGVEVEYILRTKTTNRSSTFSNDYNMYKMIDGERKLVFTTQVDESKRRISEVPTVIKRYFNLIEGDGGVMTFLFAREGLLALNQSPQAFRRTVANVVNLEAGEQALKNMKDDMRETLKDAMRVSNEIDVHSIELNRSQHLRVDFYEEIEKSVSQVEQLERASGLLTSCRDEMQGISVDYPLIKALDDTKALDLISELTSGLASLVYPNELLEVSFDERFFEKVRPLGESLLKELDAIEVDGRFIPELPLKDFDIAVKLVDELDAFQEFGSSSPEIEVSLDDKSFSLMLEVNSLLNDLEVSESEIASLEMELESERKRLSHLLEGHSNVGICSICHNVTTLEPVSS